MQTNQLFACLNHPRARYQAGGTAHPHTPESTQVIPTSQSSACLPCPARSFPGTTVKAHASLSPCLLADLGWCLAGCAFLENPQYKRLPSRQSLPCLHVLPHLIKQTLGTFKTRGQDRWLLLGSVGRRMSLSKRLDLLLPLERSSNHVIYRLSLKLGGSVHHGQMDHMSSSGSGDHLFPALENPLLAGPELTPLQLLERMTPQCRKAHGDHHFGGMGGRVQACQEEGKDRGWTAVQEARMAMRVAVDTSSHQGEEVPAAATGNGEAQGRNKLREYSGARCCSQIPGAVWDQGQKCQKMRAWLRDE